MSRRNSRSSRSSCCQWLKSVVCFTCTLDCTQIGFFIICRFVVRVLRLRGRANRGRLAHRRRWGSRNLLSTSYSVFANCVNSSSPNRASSTSKTAHSAMPASRLKSCMSKTALSFNVFVSCFAIAAWSLFCAFISVVFVCLMSQRYASFFVTQTFSKVFFRAIKKAAPQWSRPKQTMQKTVLLTSTQIYALFFSASLCAA